MSPRVRVGVMAAVAAVLLGAILLQWVVTQYFAYDHSTGTAKNARMQSLLGAPLNGWEMKDEPLANTEAYAQDVRTALNLDDYFYRIYRRADASFAVFVCYWAPNKMPANLVASHTPDRCWSQSGWICDKFDLWRDMPAGAERLQPGFWRTFRGPAGHRQEVIYWHLIGGRAQLYSGNRFNQVVNWRFWWKEAFLFGVNGNAEQYFVRITSERPLSELWGMPGFQEMLTRLAGMGVRQRP